MYKYKLRIETTEPYITKCWNPQHSNYKAVSSQTYLRGYLSLDSVRYKNKNVEVVHSRIS